jgi:hypothetical protein
MNSNPALKISNFTKFSKIVFDELNLARSNPKEYAKKLTKIKSNIKDNLLNLNGNGIYFTEGTKAFDEAIEFLKSYPTPSNLTLSWTKGIVSSADELLNYLILHEGIEGMSEMEKKIYDLDKRMNHYGASFGELDELIDYGTFDPEYVVVNFIVCDGDKERKERQILFNPLIKFCGISAAILPSNKMCTVINLAEFFYNPGEVVPQSILQKFTNLSLNQSVNNKSGNINNSYLEELKPRKRNDSTKLYREKEEKFKQKNAGRNYGGVINLNNTGILKNDSQVVKKEDVKEKSNVADDSSKNIVESKVVSEKEKEKPVEAKKSDKVENKNNKVDDLILPENVDRVNFIEKKVKDKKTGKDILMVKKTIFYSDGNKDIILYKK